MSLKGYIYKLLNGGWWFWGLGAMIGETMMKFSGSRTMSEGNRYISSKST